MITKNLIAKKEHLQIKLKKLYPDNFKKVKMSKWKTSNNEKIPISCG